MGGASRAPACAIRGGAGRIAGFRPLLLHVHNVIVMDMNVLLLPYVAERDVQHRVAHVLEIIVTHHWVPAMVQIAEHNMELYFITNTIALHHLHIHLHLQTHHQAHQAHHLSHTHPHNRKFHHVLNASAAKENRVIVEIMDAARLRVLTPVYLPTILTIGVVTR